MREKVRIESRLEQYAEDLKTIGYFPEDIERKTAYTRKAFSRQTPLKVIAGLTLAGGYILGALTSREICQYISSLGINMNTNFLEIVYGLSSISAVSYSLFKAINARDQEEEIERVNLVAKTQREILSGYRHEFPSYIETLDEI